MGDKASLVRGAFLFCLSHTGNMTIAAEFAGASRAQIIAMMRQDAAFQQASEQAMQEAEERVFFVAMERAIKGVKVPRFYQGAIIGYVPIPSDMLLRYVLESSWLEHSNEFVFGKLWQNGALTWPEPYLA